MSSELSCNIFSAALLVIITTSFPFGFNGSLLNQPLVYVREFFNDTYTERRRGGKPPSHLAVTVLLSLTFAAFPLGSMVGKFFAGYLMDTIGRKNSILVGHGSLLAGTVLATCCVIGKSPEMLMIGRLLHGFLGGISNSTTPIFLAEISPSKYRGAMGVGHQLAMSFGGLVAAVVGIPQSLSTAERWPYLHLINGLFFVLAFLFLPLIPETPRYIYLVVGNEEKARKSLVWYRGRQDVDGEMNEMAREKAAYANDMPFYLRNLFDRKLRRALVVAIVLQLSRQLSGMNALNWYSAYIFETAGIHWNVIPYLVIGLNGVAVIANLVAIPLIDVVGRRRLLILSSAGMTADMAILVVAIAIQPTHPWVASISIICIYMHILLTQVGIGPISWILPAELFQQRARPLAGMFAGVANSTAFITLILVFHPVQEVIGEYVFLLFAALLLAFLIFAILVVPETKNRRFSEIARQMASRRVSYVPG